MMSALLSRELEYGNMIFLSKLFTSDLSLSGAAWIEKKKISDMTIMVRDFFMTTV